MPSTDLVRRDSGDKAIGRDDRGGPPLDRAVRGPGALRLEGSRLRDAIIDNLE